MLMTKYQLLHHRKEAVYLAVMHDLISMGVVDPELLEASFGVKIPEATPPVKARVSDWS